MSFAPLASLLVACALGAAVIPSTSAAEDDAPRQVRAIEWEGVERVSPEELEAAILTTKASWRFWVEDRPFDPGTLEQDLERLHRFYRHKGFYDAAIRSEVEERNETAVIVRFFVEEGPTIALEALGLSLAHRGTEASPLDEDALRRDLPLAVGSDFSSERYEQTKEALQQRMQKLGYPASTLGGGAEVNLERRAARVDWKLDPGPYVRLGEATPVGLEEVSADLVLDEVRWKPGDPYDPDVLRKTQRALFGLGLFRSVSIKPLPPQRAAGPGPLEEQWPLEIRVEERSPRALRAGVGFGTEDRLRVKLEWKHRNFLGGRRSLRIGGKYSFLERGVETVFVQPHFLDRETDLTLDALIGEETTPAFDARGVSGGWLLERPLFREWEGRFGQRVERKRVTEVDADAPIVRADEDESFQLVTFDLGLRRSSLDSALDPREGSWLDFSLEPSFAALGSDVDYVKALAEARLFFPLPRSMVLATRVRLGTVEPFGGDGPPDVPIFKRFFSGGSASVRGFDLNRLGPLDDDEDPIGGLTLAEGSVELRSPLWKQLGGVVFVDAGQVALDSFELRGGDFFYSAGAGLRYQTPIGPLRLDFAHILNPPSGISGFRIHFSVGHAF